MPNVQLVQSIVDDFNKGVELLQKQAYVYDMEKKAYVPTPQPAPPMTAQPPMDPAAMQGGAPMPPGAPMDPAAMGGAPMPPGAPMDPAAMQGGAPMPADPAAMQGGAPIPPGAPMDPAAQGGGGMNPEMETALSDLANGVETTAQTAEQTKTQVDQLAQRQLATEQEISELREQLKNPAPLEGQGDAAAAGAAPTKEQPADAGLQAIAPQAAK